jgi:hypothetical protein
VKLGSHVRIDDTDIDAFIDRGRVTPGDNRFSLCVAQPTAGCPQRPTAHPQLGPRLLDGSDTAVNVRASVEVRLGPAFSDDRTATGGRATTIPPVGSGLVTSTARSTRSAGSTR